MNLKKKIQAEKDNLAKDLASFEDLKFIERKKIEEEKRRIKRDQSLLDKRIKAQTQEKCKTCEQFKIEVNKLEQNLKTKESKFTEEITKLKSHLKLVKGDNQELQNEIQKMTLPKELPGYFRSIVFVGKISGICPIIARKECTRTI